MEIYLNIQIFIYSLYNIQIGWNPNLGSEVIKRLTTKLSDQFVEDRFSFSDLRQYSLRYSELCKDFIRFHKAKLKMIKTKLSILVIKTSNCRVWYCCSVT